jgi:hypothetical protein
MNLPSTGSSQSLRFSLPKFRLLGGNDEDSQSSYFVDSDGNAYEPYSLAWRYLGMYIDCDVEDDIDQYLYSDGGVNRALQEREEGRILKSGDKSGDGDGDDCSRKVLWAAYRDPGYMGGSIGEYQFYDWRTDTWDKTTCQTSRCAKMDCHARGTHWKLMGVFKETDGLVDWAEQLFKHEGYCLWDGDKEEGNGEGSHDGNRNNGGKDSSGNYEFMSARQQKWVQSCSKLYLKDSDGNSVYRHTRPLAGGNITDALYYDEHCSQRAAMSWPEYIIAWFSYYYYNAEGGQTVAKSWMASTERWNELMTDYKICQPCRAYNKVTTSAYNNNGDGGHRFLDQDGEGDEEQWGYNCNDDAGYLNCNQCHKFETKTSMELATTSDLERATKQGTILSIKVDGVIYGEGGFHAVDDNRAQATAGVILVVMVVMAVVAALCVVFKKQIVRLMGRFRRRQLNAGNLKETFLESPDEVQEIFHQMQDEISRKNKLIEKQRQNLERLRLELDQERTLREMELNMIHRENNRSGERHQSTLLSRDTPEGGNSSPPLALEECHLIQENGYRELRDLHLPPDAASPMVPSLEPPGPVVDASEPSGIIEYHAGETSKGPPTESADIVNPCCGSKGRGFPGESLAPLEYANANSDIPARSFGSVSAGPLDGSDKSDFVDIRDSAKHNERSSEPATLLDPLDAQHSVTTDILSVTTGPAISSDRGDQIFPMHNDFALEQVSSGDNLEERDAKSLEIASKVNIEGWDPSGVVAGDISPAVDIEPANTFPEVENESSPASAGITDPEYCGDDKNNQGDDQEPSFALGVV